MQNCLVQVRARRSHWNVNLPGNATLPQSRQPARKVATVADFAPALYLLCALICVPIVNVVATAAGSAMVYLIAAQSASRAASSATYGAALKNASSEAAFFTQSGLAKLLNLQPVGGVKHSGLNLYVKATDFNTNASTTYGPNAPVMGNVNPSSQVYEYASKMSCTVGPLLNLASVPILASIPGLGTAKRVDMTVSCACQYPQGLATTVCQKTTEQSTQSQPVLNSLTFEQGLNPWSQLKLSASAPVATAVRNPVLTAGVQAEAAPSLTVQSPSSPVGDVLFSQQVGEPKAQYE